MKIGLLLAPLILVSNQLCAESTLTMPKYAALDKLLRKDENAHWVNELTTQVSENNIKPYTLTLPPGEYRYSVKFKSAKGIIRGTMTVEPDEQLYMHRGISSDMQDIFAWTSTAAPRSPEYKFERKEAFCRSLIGDDAETFSPYKLQACQALAAQNNATGILGLGYCKSKGLGLKRDHLGALSLYQQAFELGNQQAAIEAYRLNPESQIAFDMMQKLSQQQHPFAMGIYAAKLYDKGIQNYDKAETLAWDSLNGGFIFNLPLLSLINFTLHSDEPKRLYKSAAFSMLLALNAEEMDHHDELLAEQIMDNLPPDAQPKVKQTLMDLLPQISQPYTLLIDSKSFKPLAAKGALKLIVQNHYEIAPIDFNQMYQIDYINQWQTKTFALELNGDTESQKNFTFEALDTTSLCLYYDSNIDALKVAPLSQSEWCKDKQMPPVQGWHVMQPQQGIL